MVEPLVELSLSWTINSLSGLFAYIGPGAGFAFLTSFLVLFITFWAVFLSVLTWPVRVLLRKLRRRTRHPTSVRRVIVVGLDGLEPTLTEDFMARGRLPNLKKLSELGTYSRLKTTFPAVSPVSHVCIVALGNKNCTAPLMCCFRKLAS